MQSAADGLISSTSTAATISHVPVMPLRVIDVEATILNREGGGIVLTRQRSWHVISHTWSADVREFSKTVGRRLKSALLEDREEDGGRSYEQLFKDANFSDASSYQTFVDFLIILRLDGVRWVWFDAICINQTDLQEKDAEIQQMGTYYENSLGSYVLHHGIGKGFELLDRNTQSNTGQHLRLPRWFSRAWTFQEWVLPHKTTFIIDLVSDQNLRKTAATAFLISNSQSCLCCNYQVTFHPPFVSQCMHSIHEKAAGDEHEYDLFTSSSARVRHCLYNIGAQRDHFRRIPDRKDWYFTDDLGYIFLVKLKLQMRNAILWSAGGGSVILKEHAMSDPEFELTDRLGVKMSVRGMSAYKMTKESKMPLVIEEVSVRDCSNAEDRVLSVLKLLDVEGAIQVRSGKSLKEQIIHLAKGLWGKAQYQYNEVLLQLCLADGFGNQTQGMSWAPHFEVKQGSWQEGGRELAERYIVNSYSTFKGCAKVQEVSKAGELRLVSEAVCTGQLVCCNHDFQVHKDRRRADELVKPMVLQVGGQNVAHLCVRFSAQLAPEACVLEHVGSTSAEHALSCIVIRAPRICDSLDHLPFRKAQLHNPLDYLQEQIPVWLVKMGVGVGEVTPKVVTYFLVCTGKNLHSPLHKIGYVGISSDIVSNSKFSCLLETRETMCLLGGLGRHSTKHLFKKGTCFSCDCFDCFLSGYDSS